MDSRSCGFYITAINADKHIPQDEQCGGLYCETTPFTCSSDYNITFSCTNTTYLDSNGNAQGVTIFVATDCDSNERLSPDQQDPRYYPIYDSENILEQLSLTAIIESKSGDPDPYIDYDATPDPSVLPTCLRGCLCGYSPNDTQDDAAIMIYRYCDCVTSLVYFFIDLAISLLGPYTPVYTTPTNLSLLLHYGVDFDIFDTAIVNYTVGVLTDADGSLNWVNISEGSNLTLQKGFECFGDYETIGDIFVDQLPHP